MKGKVKLPASFKARFLPFNPISFSLTKFKIFVLFVITLAAGWIFYLRLNNQNELEILNNKHKEIRCAVEKYLENMTRVKINSQEAEYFERKIYDSKKKLKVLEDSIKQIKTIWFME